MLLTWGECLSPLVFHFFAREADCFFFREVSVNGDFMTGCAITLCDLKLLLQVITFACDGFHPHKLMWVQLSFSWIYSSFLRLLCSPVHWPWDASLLLIITLLGSWIGTINALQRQWCLSGWLFRLKGNHVPSSWFFAPAPFLNVSGKENEINLSCHQREWLHPFKCSSVPWPDQDSLFASSFFFPPAASFCWWAVMCTQEHYLLCKLQPVFA